MNIGPHELIRQLYVAGVEVSLTKSNTVRITGQSVPKGLIAQLQEHKEEIIRILQAQGVGTDEDGFDSPLPRRYVVPPACIATRACARLGPCSQSLMRHCCVRVSDSAPGAAPSGATNPVSNAAENSTGHHHEVEVQHGGSLELYKILTIIGQ